MSSMTRRGFFGSLAAMGLFSFLPKSLRFWNRNRLVTPAWVTNEAALLYANQLKFMKNVSRQYEDAWSANEVPPGLRRGSTAIRGQYQ